MNLFCSLWKYLHLISEADKGGGGGGGVGCRGYGYLICGHFVAGHITWCMDKMSADKILGDKTPVKIARPFYGRGRAILVDLGCTLIKFCLFEFCLVIIGIRR